ncbi:hypothetical protein [Dyadobacter sp. 3J3]|uniref:hypothetical protein n=1 Tax=Dyadobacter sp. 3J3 TaxID=2606600 RepID=UPI00135AD12F|nr:hypothetical protein [Dyadobacter sp. 3J3]
MFCTPVEEYSDVSSDVKYRILDQAQNGYSSTHHFKKEVVKDRECFVFTTYEEASKKREEFLIDRR